MRDDMKDVSEFHHQRINHPNAFANQANHINGIENFRNQAKRHLRRYNDIAKAQSPLSSKSANGVTYRPARRLLTLLTQWIDL